MNEIALRLAQHVRSAAFGGGDLAIVLNQLAVAGKLIARELSQAALVGRLGDAGRTNVQGEVVKKLDLWANDVVVRALEASGLTAPGRVADQHRAGSGQPARLQCEGTKIGRAHV